MASAVLQKLTEKVMTQKDRLTAQCDKRALENQSESTLARKAKEVRGLCVDV